MTSIDIHYTRLSSLAKFLLARSHGFMLGELVKASIVRIAPSDLMTSIDKQLTILGSCATFPFPSPTIK